MELTANFAEVAVKDRFSLHCGLEAHCNADKNKLARTLPGQRLVSSTQ
jgi:hypothetical protein